MQKTLTYIWRFFLVLLFLSGLALITLWLLRAYDYPILHTMLPDDAFEPLITLFSYITGFSGVGAVATWFAQKRSNTADQRTIATGGGDYAEQNMDKRQGAFYTGGTHYHYGDPRVASPSALAPRLRAELLTALANRYTQRIEDSLAVQARIALELQTMPAAVAPQWRMHLHGPTPPRELLPGTPIPQVFDQACGELLILGAPGAGKTTLLLELAGDLVARAQADGDHPIPVVVNLASWAQQAQPLEQWLPDAIHAAAGVSTQVAGQLLTGRHLLLLLDGLDEVAEGKRADCIKAINTYCAAQRPLRLVVCSRSAEYAAAGAQLHLNAAVELAPLTLPQVGAALKDVPKARGVLVALRDDPLLRELLTTPLMLNITLLAYAGQPLPDVQARTLDERRAALFGAYARRMLQQRPVAPFTHRQVVRGLHWLAARMRQDDMTDFLLERMQPAWLPALRPYRLLSGLGVGLGVGLVLGLGVGLVLGLGFGLVLGLGVGLVLGLVFGKNATITPDEQLIWSWRRAWSGLRASLGVGLVVGLGVGLVFGLVVGLVFGLVVGLVGGLLGGLVFVLVFGLVGGLNNGFVRRELATTIRPNQGIRASLWNGLRRGLGGGLGGGLVGGLGGGLVGGLVGGLGGGLLGGLGSMLDGGLGAFLQHYVLRFLLARQRLLPWDAVRFLDTARDLLVLQRDGGIYRFRHILLRDYFASLTPEEVAALARGDDGVMG
jgi:hypothetical protein